jgi:hypothetical protein
MCPASLVAPVATRLQAISPFDSKQAIALRLVSLLPEQLRLQVAEPQRAAG